MEPHIIGGMFGLEPGLRKGAEQAPALAILALEHRLLATARGAFWLLDVSLEPAAIWLPSYLCEVVLLSFTRPGCALRFYPVDASLELSDRSWIDEVQNSDMVVFIDYFGFNTWSTAGALVRSRGACVVEDASQAMLNSEFDPSAHFVIASPRKFVGVPDGGILAASHSSRLPDLVLPPPPRAWWLDSFAASRGRAAFDAGNPDRLWYDLFNATDRSAPATGYAMSELSAVLLLDGIDYAAVATRRRTNFQVLAAALGDVALFTDLPEHVVPLGFPIVVRDRDDVRAAFFAERVYPPLHWPISSVVPDHFEDSHRLSASIMTLPCDQRYDERDMQRLVAGVRRVGASPPSRLSTAEEL